MYAPDPVRLLIPRAALRTVAGWVLDAPPPVWRCLLAMADEYTVFPDTVTVLDQVAHVSLSSAHWAVLAPWLTEHGATLHHVPPRPGEPEHGEPATFTVRVPGEAELPLRSTPDSA